MAQSIPALARGGTVLQQAVHRANRCHVTAFIEQLRIDHRQRAMGKAWTIEDVQHDSVLQFDCQRRRWDAPVAEAVGSGQAWRVARSRYNALRGSRSARQAAATPTWSARVLAALITLARSACRLY